jgi:hypothetical protein
MTFLFVILAGVWRPEHVQIAMGAFSLCAGLLLGGSTWVNAKERDVEQARVTNRGG